MPAAYEAADLQRIFGRITERLRAIEEQLAVLSRQAGVPYEKPGDDVPPEVVELVRAGKQMHLSAQAQTSLITAYTPSPATFGRVALGAKSEHILRGRANARLWD